MEYSFFGLAKTRRTMPIIYGSIASPLVSAL
jgi:hypothetical protein